MEKWKSQLKSGDTVYFTHGETIKRVYSGKISPYWNEAPSRICLSSMPGVSRGNPWYLFLGKPTQFDPTPTVFRVRVVCNREWYEVDADLLFRTHGEAVKNALWWCQREMCQVVDKEYTAKTSLRWVEEKKKILVNEITRLKGSLKSRKSVAKPKKSRAKK